MKSVGQYRMGLEPPASAPDHDAGKNYGGWQKDDLEIEEGSLLQGIGSKGPKRGFPGGDRQNIPFFGQPRGRMEKKVAVAWKIHEGIGRKRGMPYDHNCRPWLAFL